MLLEKVLDVILSCVEGEVSYVQFSIHFVTDAVRSACWFPELFPEFGFQIIIEAGSPEDSPCWKCDNTNLNSGKHGLDAQTLQALFLIDVMI